MPPRVAMDRWKYYDIIHQRHSLMNPVDETRLERLYDLLELKPNARVIDIGCGKGEMLIRLAEKYQIKGLGIDKSPYCVREAEKRKRQRVPNAELKFLEMDGAQYKPGTGEGSDLAMCIGAHVDLRWLQEYRQSSRRNDEVIRIRDGRRAVLAHKSSPRISPV